MALEPSQFRQAIIENTLRSCQLFMGLPAADIVAIASFIISKHLDKGEYLFREGDRSEGFYVVQKGAINVHRVNAAGKEQVIHLFQPIESFAEGTLATEGGYPRMRARPSLRLFCLYRRTNLSISCEGDPILHCACSAQ